MLGMLVFAVTIGASLLLFADYFEGTLQLFIRGSPEFG